MKGKKGLWPFKTQGKTPQPELVLDPDPAGGEALLSPLAGAVVPLESVSDPVFAGKVLGDGLAVEPAEGMLYSPADGTVETLMDSCHAVCITTKAGADVLIHVGRDTVSLNGKHFTAHVKEGDQVRRGQLLLEFDMAAIRSAGFELTTPIIVSNYDEFRMELRPAGEVRPGNALITLYPRQD